MKRLRLPPIRWPKLPAINPNLAVFAVGLVLFGAGAYAAYPPAGLIGPGIILMAIALFGDKRP